MMSCFVESSVIVLRQKTKMCTPLGPQDWETLGYMYVGTCMTVQFILYRSRREMLCADRSVETLDIKKFWSGPIFIKCLKVEVLI